MCMVSRTPCLLREVEVRLEPPASSHTNCRGSHRAHRPQRAKESGAISLDHGCSRGRPEPLTAPLCALPYTFPRPSEHQRRIRGHRLRVSCYARRLQVLPAGLRRRYMSALPLTVLTPASADSRPLQRLTALVDVSWHRLSLAVALVPLEGWGGVRQCVCGRPHTGIVVSSRTRPICHEESSTNR